MVHPIDGDRTKSAPWEKSRISFPDTQAPDIEGGRGEDFSVKPEMEHWGKPGLTSQEAWFNLNLEPDTLLCGMQFFSGLRIHVNTHICIYTLTQHMHIAFPHYNNVHNTPGKQAFLSCISLPLRKQALGLCEH